MLVASAHPDKRHGPHANKRTAIARIVFDADGTASVDGIVYRPKPLALAPLVDAAGYTLALRINDHNLRVKAKRRRHLPYHPASLADLDLQL